jgi:alpha-tubulin suppressor-like RCC1 family protein
LSTKVVDVSDVRIPILGALCEVYFALLQLLFCCSGQTTAVITPRQVTVGLGRKQVNVVAAAKHHTVIATESGELFTWGSNRGMCECMMYLECIFSNEELQKLEQHMHLMLF